MSNIPGAQKGGMQPVLIIECDPETGQWRHACPTAIDGRLLIGMMELAKEDVAAIMRRQIAQQAASEQAKKLVIPSGSPVLPFRA